MVLYNITVIIEETINADWLAWMNENFIPSAMDSELIASNRLLKVIDSPNEGITYCLQFVIDDLTTFQQFKDKWFSDLMDKHTAKFNNRFVSFSTLMEFIDN